MGLGMMGLGGGGGGGGSGGHGGSAMPPPGSTGMPTPTNISPTNALSPLAAMLNPMFGLPMMGLAGAGAGAGAVGAGAGTGAGGAAGGE